MCRQCHSTVNAKAGSGSSAAATRRRRFRSRGAGSGAASGWRRSGEGARRSAADAWQSARRQRARPRAERCARAARRARRRPLQPDTAASTPGAARRAIRAPAFRSVARAMVEALRQPTPALPTWRARLRTKVCPLRRMVPGGSSTQPAAARRARWRRVSVDSTCIGWSMRRECHSTARSRAAATTARRPVEARYGLGARTMPTGSTPAEGKTASADRAPAGRPARHRPLATAEPPKPRRLAQGQRQPEWSSGRVVSGRVVVIFSPLACCRTRAVPASGRSTSLHDGSPGYISTADSLAHHLSQLPLCCHASSCCGMCPLCR